MAGVTSYRDKLWHRLRIFHTAVVGVYAKNNTAYAVYAEQRGQRWYLTGRERLNINAGDALPDKVRLAMTKRGQALTTPVSLCLTTDELTVMTANFGGVEPEEMSEAVYWEIRERNKDSSEKYLSVFMRLPDIDDYYWLAALPQTTANKLAADWRQSGLTLNALTVASPDEPGLNLATSPIVWRSIEFYPTQSDWGGGEQEWEYAVYAAGVLIAPLASYERLNFYGEVSLLNWRKLSGMWLVAVLGVLVLLSGLDCYRLYAIKTEAAQVTAKLSLLHNQRNEVREIESLWSAYRVKSRLLKELTDSRLPWHGLMVYLGTLPMDDVCLTELYLTDEGRLKMCGYAANYGKLADFMAVLERKITSRVTLEDAETNVDENRLNFVLELELADKP